MHIDKNTRSARLTVTRSPVECTDLGSQKKTMDRHQPPVLSLNFKLIGSPRRDPADDRNTDTKPDSSQPDRWDIAHHSFHRHGISAPKCAA